MARPSRERLLDATHLLSSNGFDDVVAWMRGTRICRIVQAVPGEGRWQVGEIIESDEVLTDMLVGNGYAEYCDHME